MSKTINRVQVLGRVGQDPEVHNAQNGSMITRISVATDEGYFDKKANQKVDKTEWHRIVAFGKLAELISQYVKKGSKVLVEGKLETSSWDDANGVKKYSTEIIANDIVFLDSKNESGQGQQAPQQQGHYQGQQQYQQQPQQQYQNQNQSYQQAKQGGQAPYQQGQQQPQQAQYQGQQQGQNQNIQQPTQQPTSYSPHQNHNNNSDVPF